MLRTQCADSNSSRRATARSLSRTRFARITIAYVFYRLCLTLAQQGVTSAVVYTTRTEHRGEFPVFAFPPESAKMQTQETAAFVQQSRGASAATTRPRTPQRSSCGRKSRLYRTQSAHFKPAWRPATPNLTGSTNRFVSLNVTLIRLSARLLLTLGCVPDPVVHTPSLTTFPFLSAFAGEPRSYLLCSTYRMLLL